MDAAIPRPKDPWASRLGRGLGRALTAVAFAPLQALYLAGLLGLVAGLAAFRALGPLRRPAV